MNPDKVVKTGNALFVGGCAISLLFWIVIPLFTLGILFILSMLGVLD